MVENTELEKRVNNWDDKESRYAIGDLCAYGNPGYYYQVNISIHEYGSEIPVVYSGEQCLPSSYGIVEFDISNSNIGYVVSGTGSQGGCLCPWTKCTALQGRCNNFRFGKFIFQ